MFTDAVCGEGWETFPNRFRDVRVTLISDLNSDSLDDYVITNVCSTGAPNSPAPVHVVLGHGGEPLLLEYEEGGEWASLLPGISEANGTLITMWSRYSDADPVCCPSFIDTVKYTLADSGLVVTVEAEPPTASTPGPESLAFADVVDVALPDGTTVSIYGTTQSQYPAGEERFWAVGTVQFVLDVDLDYVPADKHSCVVREFLQSDQGQQLVADDVAGNLNNWVDSEGWPLFVGEAVGGWYATQTTC